MERLYRVRIAQAGATEISAATTAFFTDDVVLPPVVTTQIVHPTTGRSEMRPWRIELLDEGGALSAAFIDNGRWTAIGRLCDISFRAPGEATPGTTYGTGRISGINEGDGPGKYLIEISPESWVARRAQLFSEADTVQLWPQGIKADWKGFEAAEAGQGFNVISGPDGASPSLRVLILRSFGRGRRVTDPLVNYIREQLVENPTRAVDADASTNNFGPLRLRYNGIEYPIISFGTDAQTPEFTNSLDREAARKGQDGALWGVGFHTQIMVTFWEPGVTPPDDAAGFIHLEGAPPSDTVPLHIGIADAAHEFGTGQGFIHPAELTKRVWDKLGVRYDAAALTAIKDDRSFPLLAPRVTEQVDDAEAWLAENAWGPTMLAALTAGDGRRKLVDMRLPQDLQTGTLPVIDASNAAAGTWSLTGREAVNSITWDYLSLQEPSQERRAVRKGSNTEVTDSPADADLDGLIANEREVDPIEGDTIGTIGRRSLKLSLHGALEPTAETERRRRAIAAGGVIWQSAVPELSRELLDIFQDGAYRLRGEVGRTIAETLEEGDLALLDLASLQLPNPVSGARSDLRLVRLLSIERHPAHAVCEFLDLGPDAQPLAAPTVSIDWSAATPGEVEVTLSLIPAGATAEVQVAYTNSISEPTRWPIRRANLGNGVHVFGNVPAAGFAHVRARSTAPGRIRSAWVLDNVGIGDRPAILNAALIINSSGLATVSILPSAAVAGVRLRSSVHGASALPSYGATSDHAVGAFPLQLAGVVVSGGKSLTVELEPWDGFTAGAVSGNAGQKVTVSTERDPVQFILSMRVEITNLTANVADIRVWIADTSPGPDVSVAYSADGPVTPASPQTILGTNVTSDLETTGFLDFTADLASGTQTVTFRATAPDRNPVSQALSFGIEGAPGADGAAGRLRFFGIGGVNVTDLTIEVQHDTGEGGELFVWVNPSSLGSPDPTSTAADGSVVFASTPFVANNATIFNLTGGGTDDLLNNIPVTALIPKQVFARAEFDDGTIAEGYYALPGVIQIVDPDGILAGNVVGSTNIQDDAIQTPHLSANSVVADKIGAREVTIEKLTIGSFANLIPDPGFESGDLADSEWTVFDAGGGTFSIVSSSVRTGGFALNFNRTGQTAAAGIAHSESLTQCNPGDPFYHSGWFRGTGAGSGTSAGPVIRFFDELGVAVGTVANFTVIPVGSYNFRDIEAVAPAGAVFVRFEYVILNDGTTPAIRIDDGYANRQVPGELVVDGAITAPKINVTQLDAISADVGVLTAGRLESAAGSQNRGIVLSGTRPAGWRKWIDFTATGNDNIIRFGIDTGGTGNADAQFRVEADGDAFFAGTLEAASGEFAGNLSASEVVMTATPTATITANQNMVLRIFGGSAETIQLIKSSGGVGGIGIGGAFGNTLDVRVSTDDFIDLDAGSSTSGGTRVGQTNQRISFFGISPKVRQSVTGSTTNGKLTSLLGALEFYGLIIDATT